MEKTVFKFFRFWAGVVFCAGFALWLCRPAAALGDEVTPKRKTAKMRGENGKTERMEPIVDSSLLMIARDSSAKTGMPGVAASVQAPVPGGWKPSSRGDEGGSEGGSERSSERNSERSGSQKPVVIDEIVAVIGTKMVKLSDVERALENMRAAGEALSGNARCEAMEGLMVSALYELQADEDSIKVGESEVEAELEARIRYFVDQIGSREKLEEFYGKSILQIKEEYREMIKANIIAVRMENKITEDVKVTPSEVRRFYALLPKDSVPLVPLTFELQYIVREPRISLSEKDVARGRLSEIRQRIVEKGERFEGLAALYSQDPGSARKGGDVGYGSRGTWAPEFESMAFSLPKGEVSPIFETQYGFHILEVLDKKGEEVRVRHILIAPEANDIDLYRTRGELDSVAAMVRNGEYTIKEAVSRFSDEAGRQGDGIYLSPLTRKPLYTADELEPMVYLAIQDLDEGQNTNALPFQTQDGHPAYRMFYVKKRIAPHRATLESDYDKIYDMALAKAKQKAMQEWMTNKISNTYVRIMPRYKDCKFLYKWKSM